MSKLNLIVSAALSLVFLTACETMSGPTSVSEQAMAKHSSTCLKSGIPADTDAHTECVIKLHEQEQKRAGRLQSIEPKKVEPSRTDEWGF